jgi:hypothetical protein
VSPLTGSMVIEGGMGVNGALYVNGQSHFLSSLFCSELCTFQKGIIVQNVAKKIQQYQFNPSMVAGAPLVVDYSIGSVLLLPTDFSFVSNFHCTIINIPVDRSITYEISLVYKQTSTNYYCTTIELYDVSGALVYGPSAVKFHNNIQITTYPVIIYQTFTVVCFNNISGTSPTREVLCTSMKVF